MKQMGRNQQNIYNQKEMNQNNLYNQMNPYEKINYKYQPEKSKKKRGGMIFAIVIGVMLLLALIGVGIIIFIHTLFARSEQDAVFEKNGIVANWDMSQTRLENGAVYNNADGSVYESVPVYWTAEIVKDEEFADGYRNIEIEVLAQFCEEEISEVIGDGTFTFGWGIYDYYSGMRLPNEYGTYALAVGDNQVPIEILNYSYKSLDSTEDSDYSRQYLLSYSIRVPSDYDGLVFAAEAMPGSYAEFQKLIKMEEVLTPEVMEDYSAVKDGLIYRFGLR